MSASALARLHSVSARGATEVANMATLKRLPVALLAALALTESRGDAAAWRFEAPYRYYWDVVNQKPFRTVSASERAGESAPGDFPYRTVLSSRDTEWIGQACSWGPLQLMGAVAREYGFRGQFPELCGWGLGLEYAGMHLLKLRNRFLDRFGWEGVVAAYNAGSPRKDDAGNWVNAEYVRKVRANGGFEGIA